MYYQKVIVQIVITIVFCWINLLCSFIRLSDYLIVNTMHHLVVHSVEILLNYLREQLVHHQKMAAMKVEVSIEQVKYLYDLDSR